jgi:hypothetical protein
LIAKGFSILAKGLEMARIIPPFGFEFRMRKMVLGERKDPSRKGPLEVLAQKCRSK